MQLEQEVLAWADVSSSEPEPMTKYGRANVFKGYTHIRSCIPSLATK